MSIEAFTWALRVPIGGNPKVILLGLANHAHPDGTDAYPSLDTLAEYAHCDRSTARRNVRKLLEAGWIMEDGRGPRGQIKYRLAMTDEPFPTAGGGETPPVAPALQGGGISAPQGVAPVPPEPSKEPSKEPTVLSRGADASASALPAMSYRGQRIHPTYVRRAVEALRVFCEATNRSISPLNGAGKPSESLRQVVGAILERPDVQFADWEAAIHATVSAPPEWVQGQVQLGHVFGAKAAQWALDAGARHRAGTPPAPPTGPRGQERAAADYMARLRAEVEGQVDASAAPGVIVDAEVIQEDQ